MCENVNVEVVLDRLHPNTSVLQSRCNVRLSPCVNRSGRLGVLMMLPISQSTQYYAMQQHFPYVLHSSCMLYPGATPHLNQTKYFQQVRRNTDKNKGQFNMDINVSECTTFSYSNNVLLFVYIPKCAVRSYMTSRRT